MMKFKNQFLLKITKNRFSMKSHFRNKILIQKFAFNLKLNLNKKLNKINKFLNNIIFNKNQK